MNLLFKLIILITPIAHHLVTKPYLNITPTSNSMKQPVMLKEPNITTHPLPLRFTNLLTFNGSVQPSAMGPCAKEVKPFVIMASDLNKHNHVITIYNQLQNKY